MKHHRCRAAILITTLCGLYSVLFGPAFNWDFYNYHYYIGYAALNHRLGTDLALNMQTYFTPTLEALNYFITSHCPQLLASFILGAISGISIYLVYAIFTTLFTGTDLKHRTLFATLATVYGLTSLTTFTQIGSWNGDQYTAIPILLGILIFIKAQLSPSQDQPYFWQISVTGLLVGLAAGLKLTTIFMGPAFFIAIFIAAIQRRHFSSIFGFMAFAALGFIIADGYWMWQLYQHFQNPFFPMFNTLFKSPYAELEGYRGTLSYIPKSALQYVFFPFFWVANHRHYIDESSVRDAHLAIVFTALILSALLYLKRHGKPRTLTPQLFLILLFLTGFYAWAALFGIVRYLYPIQLLSGIVLFICLRHIITNEKKQWVLFTVLTVIAIVSCNYPKRLSFSVDKMTRTAYYPPAAFPQIEDNAIVAVFNAPKTNLIVFAPPSTRFVGIDNLLNTLTANNAMTQQINALLHQPNHAHYLLVSQYDLSNKPRNARLNAALKKHAIRADFSTCQAFEDPFKIDKKRHTTFLLCRTTLLTGAQ